MPFAFAFYDRQKCAFLYIFALGRTGTLTICSVEPRGCGGVGLSLLPTARRAGGGLACASLACALAPGAGSGAQTLSARARTRQRRNCRLHRAQGAGSHSAHRKPVVSAGVLGSSPVCRGSQAWQPGPRPEKAHGPWHRPPVPILIWCARVSGATWRTGPAPRRPGRRAPFAIRACRATRCSWALTQGPCPPVGHGPRAQSCRNAAKRPRARRPVWSDAGCTPPAVPWRGMWPGQAHGLGGRRAGGNPAAERAAACHCEDVLYSGAPAGPGFRLSHDPLRGADDEPGCARLAAFAPAAAHRRAPFIEPFEAHGWQFNPPPGHFRPLFF